MREYAVKDEYGSAVLVRGEADNGPSRKTGIFFIGIDAQNIQSK